MATVAAKPLWAALHNIAHPIQGLKVMLERWATKQTDLCNVGWAHAGFAALAFNALDHGRLFAANVRARTAAQFN